MDAGFLIREIEFFCRHAYVTPVRQHPTGASEDKA
jgi:hypothetical protein